MSPMKERERTHVKCNKPWRTLEYTRTSPEFLDPIVGERLGPRSGELRDPQEKEEQETGKVFGMHLGRRG